MRPAPDIQVAGGNQAIDYAETKFCYIGKRGSD